MNVDEIKGLHGGYWRHNIIDAHYLFNHYFPNKEMVQRLQKDLPMLIDSYPSAQRIEAKFLSKWYNQESFNENNLLVVNGSSEVIRALNHVITKITVPIPTFNEYVQLPNEKINYFILDENKKFELDVDQLLRAIKDSKSDYTVINNPNNPVGTLTSRKDIKKLLDAGVKVIIDEAFIEFAGFENSVQDMVKDYKNLIVIKSIGKSFGVAGLRLGYMLTSDKELIAAVKKYVPIWNINSVGEWFLEHFPEYRKEFNESIKKIIGERKYLEDELKKIPYLEVYPSHANFVFCKTKINARKIVEHLYDKHKILIKDGLNQSMLKSDCYIRIGVKKKDDIDKIIKALKEIKM